MAEAGSAERLLAGLPASPGVAVGPAWLFAAHDEHDEPVDAAPAGTPDEESASLSAARAQAAAELDALVSQGDARLTQDDLSIFEAHRLIAEDPELTTLVEGRIATGESAASAWQAAVDEYAGVLAGLDNSTLAERAVDVRDVGRRVLRILTGATSGIEHPDIPSILVADDLMPSDTIDLDGSIVLGFATKGGGPTSHATILARRLGVPAVVAVGDALADVVAEASLVLDGSAGTLTLDPSEATVAAATDRRAAWLSARDAARQAAAGGVASTTDGRHIEVAANVGGIEDAKEAVESGADGIGLLRTEFLYLGRASAPSEEELTETFRTIIDLMGDGLVVARTLDVGGDKPIPYIHAAHEDNPFLGVRGIRLSREEPEILAVQLRSLLRAAAGKRLAIMFPMVATIDDVEWGRQQVDSAAASLHADDQPAELQVGIMVEVPSAALLAGRLAPLVDFFSIGTNDLVQYTFAADRTSSAVAGIGDALDPAVLKLIAMVCEAARAEGRWVGVCGESASDLDAVPVFVGLGVTELSAHPIAVPEVKVEVTRWAATATEDLASRALGLPDAAAVRALVARERPT